MFNCSKFIRRDCIENRRRGNRPETSLVIRKIGKRGGIQISKYRSNISNRGGGRLSQVLYTDVYVSRYWTKVAPSVLDATRSDLSAGTDFSVREGETTRRAIFLRLQLDNARLTPSYPRPTPVSLSSSFFSLFILHLPSRFVYFSLSFSDNKIYKRLEVNLYNRYYWQNRGN